MTAAAPLALAIQPHVHALGWTLVHSVWQVSLIAAALFLLLEALRNARATTRYAAACTALGLIAATALVTYAILIGRESVAVFPAGFLAGGALTFGVAGTTALIMPSVVLAWCVGVAVASARLLNGLVQIQRIRREASRLPNDGWQETVDRLGGRLGLCTAVRVVESAAASVPTVIGWMRPVILMPAAAVMGLTPQQLEVVIAHELAHIRRHDYLVNLLQCVMETLLFYHPGVWWISGRIREEREYCCDDLVVAVCGDPIGYATTLTNLEAMRGAQPHLGLASTGGPLMKRVTRLVGSPVATRRRAVLWIAPLAGLVALAALAALAGKVVSGTHQKSDTAASEPQRVSVVLDDGSSAELTVALDGAETPAAASEPQRVSVVLDDGSSAELTVVLDGAEMPAAASEPQRVSVVLDDGSSAELTVALVGAETPAAASAKAPGILELPELVTEVAPAQFEITAEQVEGDTQEPEAFEIALEDATGELHFVVHLSDDEAAAPADADSAGFLIELVPQVSDEAPIHVMFTDADGVGGEADVVLDEFAPIDAEPQSPSAPVTADVRTSEGVLHVVFQETPAAGEQPKVDAGVEQLPPANDAPVKGSLRRVESTKSAPNKPAKKVRPHSKRER